MIELKVEMDTPTISGGDIDIHLLTIGRTTRQKINKDVEEFKTTINRQNLINNCITSHQNDSSICAKIDHILSHKTNITKVKENPTKCIL